MDSELVFNRHALAHVQHERSLHPDTDNANGRYPINDPTFFQCLSMYFESTDDYLGAADCQLKAWDIASTKSQEFEFGENMYRMIQHYIRTDLSSLNTIENARLHYLFATFLDCYLQNFKETMRKEKKQRRKQITDKRNNSRRNSGLRCHRHKSLSAASQSSSSLSSDSAKSDANIDASIDVMPNEDNNSEAEMPLFAPPKVNKNSTVVTPFLPSRQVMIRMALKHYKLAIRYSDENEKYLHFRLQFCRFLSENKIEMMGCAIFYRYLFTNPNYIFRLTADDFYRHCEFLECNQQYSLALYWYNIALNKRRNDTATFQSQSTMLVFCFVELLLNCKQFRTCYRFLQIRLSTFVKRDSSDESYFYSMYHVQKGQFLLALYYVNKAMEALDSGDETALLNRQLVNFRRALIYHKLRDLKSALNCIASVRNYCGGLANFQSAHGDMLRDSYMYDEAKSAYEYAAELNSEHVSSHLSDVAYVYTCRGDERKADYFWELSVKQPCNEDNVRVHCEYGFHLLWNFRLREALNTFDTCLLFEYKSPLYDLTTDKAQIQRNKKLKIIWRSELKEDNPIPDNSNVAIRERQLVCYYFKALTLMHYYPFAHDLSTLPSHTNTDMRSTLNPRYWDISQPDSSRSIVDDLFDKFLNSSQQGGISFIASADYMLYKIIYCRDYQAAEHIYRDASTKLQEEIETECTLLRQLKHKHCVTTQPLLHSTNIYAQSAVNAATALTNTTKSIKAKFLEFTKNIRDNDADRDVDREDSKSLQITAENFDFIDCDDDDDDDETDTKLDIDCDASTLKLIDNSDGKSKRNIAKDLLCAFPNYRSSEKFRLEIAYAFLLSVQSLNANANLQLNDKALSIYLRWQSIITHSNEENCDVFGLRGRWCFHHFYALFLHYNLKAFHKAKLQYLAALQCCRKHIWTNFHFGRLLFEMGQLEGAKEKLMFCYNIDCNAYIIRKDFQLLIKQIDRKLNAQ